MACWGVTAVFWPDAYLARVARQIRVKRVRGPLVEELRDHLLSQKAAYMREGMAEDEAERRATEDMGDALLVGGELDAAHRPGSPWRGLLAVALLLALRVVLLLASYALAGVSPMEALAGRRVAVTVLALAPLCLFALTDYTFWVRWSLPVFALWLLMVLQRLHIWVAFNPNVPLSGGLGFILASPVLGRLVPQVLAVALPVMAALLACRLRGRGWGGFGACLLPVLALMVLCWTYGDTGYDPAPCMLMAGLGLAVLALAVWDGFFRVRRGAALGLLAALLAVAVAFAVHRFNLPPADDEFSQLVAAILGGAKLVGPGANVTGATAAWRRYTDMGYLLNRLMLPGLIARWGWLPFMALMAGLVALLVWCIRRFAALENRMGRLLGLAATLTLALQTALFIPASFNLFAEHLCLPLLSDGNAMLMADTALAGILVGVLRGVNLPEAAEGRDSRRYACPQ